MNNNGLPTLPGSKSNLIFFRGFEMTDDRAINMLSDVVTELLTMARAAKKDALDSGGDYEKGRHFALYEAISLIAQQAQAFGIGESSIRLDGVNLDQVILSDCFGRECDAP